jgi:hypothetical protein
MPPENSTSNTGAHCTVDEVVDFLTDDESVGSRRVQAHVAACENCAELVGSVSRVYLLVDNCTAARGAELTSKLAVAIALAEAPRRTERRDWAEALIRWGGEVAAAGQAALGLRVVSPREGSFSFSNLAQGILAPGGWEFVPGVMAAGGEIRVAAIRGVPRATVELRATEGGRGEEASALVVTVPPDAAPEIRGRLVLLAPRDRPELAEVRQLTQEADGSWSARFTGLQPGSYVVLIEPAGRETA